MPFRFRRSIRLVPAIRLNIGKGGIRPSLGRRGHAVTFSSRGIRARAGAAPSALMRLPLMLLLFVLLAVCCVCFLAVLGGTVFAVRQGFSKSSTPSPSLTVTRSSTPTMYPSLTPLPGQVYFMTRDAYTSSPTYMPVHFVTETPTPILALTYQATTTQAALGSVTAFACLNAYPDFCIPPGKHVSCTILGKYNFTVLAPDPYGYDPDHNGIGCER